MSRQLHNNNIVILCEGTKTEFQYFVDIRDYICKECPGRFAAIKIVPVEDEMVRKKREKGKSRQFKDTDIDTSICYYCLQERSKALYDQYSAYPTRFVRETYLYMEEYGYVNGWAVFDHDDHPDRKNAMAQAKKMNVNVAFSSRCFEEWLLTHFERNATVFATSECKDLKDKELRCGTGVDGDCHGTKCIGGRLREQHYIQNYDKSSVKGLFEKYTLPLFNVALMNVAWLRTLEPDINIEEKKTYTDVDRLICYLLDNYTRYEWCKIGHSFTFRGTKLIVDSSQGGLIIKNVGGISCILGTLVWYSDTNGKEISEAISWKFIGAEESKSCLPITAGASFLCIKDGTRIIVIEF